MRRRTKFNNLVILAIFLLLLASGSVAYFVTVKTAFNVISTGKVAINLYELASPEEIKPFSDLINVKAGKTYSKIPYVENADVEPVWTRVKITLKRTDGDGSETIVEDFTPLMVLEDIGENWLANKDGFYYYNLPLSGGESTEPIFKSVKFADVIDEDFMLATYSLTINAEATQFTHNGSSPLDASWTESGEE